MIAQTKFIDKNVNIPMTKQYITVLTLSFVRYDKFDVMKNNGKSKNDSFFPICTLASAVFSEYKKLIA